MLDYLSYFNYLIDKLDVIFINELNFLRIILLILMVIIGCIMIANGSLSDKTTIIPDIIQLIGLILTILSVILVYPSHTWVKKLDTNYRKKRYL